MCLAEVIVVFRPGVLRSDVLQVVQNSLVGLLGVQLDDGLLLNFMRLQKPFNGDSRTVESQISFCRLGSPAFFGIVGKILLLDFRSLLLLAYRFLDI